MLLLMSRGGSGEVGEVREELAGDVSLDAADDLFLGLALGGAAGDVVAGWLVVTHAHESYAP